MNAIQLNISPFTKGARKAALEQAISPLQKNKKNSALLEKLNQLLAFNRKQNVEENKEEEKAIESLRHYLREKIPSALHDQAFQLQLMLARHWPVNNIDKETRQPLDPISLEFINNINEAVPLSSGHLILKTSLNQYYAQRQAYTSRSPRHPVISGTQLSQREIDYLIRQGINLVPPENQATAAPNPPPQRNSFQEQLNEQRHEQLFERINELRNEHLNEQRFDQEHPFLTGSLSRRYEYNREVPNSATNNNFIAFMSDLGAKIGALFLMLLLNIPRCFIYFAPPTIELILLSIMFTSGIINGIIAYRDKGFWRPFLIGIIASWILIYISLIGPNIIAALGAASMISTVTAASVNSVLSYILPVFPALPLLYGIAREFIHPKSLNLLFCKIFLVAVHSPIIAFGTLFGETARLLSQATYAICEIFSSERFQRAHPNHAPQTEDYSEPYIRNELSANAQIYHSLGIEYLASPLLNMNENSVNVHLYSRPAINLTPSIPLLARNMANEEREESLRQVPSPY